MSFIVSNRYKYFLYFKRSFDEKASIVEQKKYENIRKNYCWLLRIIFIKKFAFFY